MVPEQLHQFGVTLKKKGFREEWKVTREKGSGSYLRTAEVRQVALGHQIKSCVDGSKDCDGPREVQEQLQLSFLQRNSQT